MNYYVITHDFGVATCKPEGQLPLQHLGTNYAVITQALKFSTESGLGGGGENQGQKLISNKQERIR